MDDEQIASIKQIIPASGWFAVFDSDGEKTYMPIVAWGSVEVKIDEGDHFRLEERVVGFGADNFAVGLMRPASCYSYFKGYVFDSQFLPVSAQEKHLPY